MKIGQVMTRNVASCSPVESLNEAARIMWERDCGSVPIVDAEQKLIGMITDRDICMAAYTQGRPLEQIRIEDVMSRNIVSCSVEQNVGVAEHRMREAKVRRIPVVDDGGKLIGLVSLNDLAIEAANERVKAIRGTGLEQVAATLAAICEHRAEKDASHAA
jgi:CBS domain-containing protein